MFLSSDGLTKAMTKILAANRRGASGIIIVEVSKSGQGKPAMCYTFLI